MGYITGGTIPNRFIRFFFSSRRRHTRFDCDWSSDVCSSDLGADLRERLALGPLAHHVTRDVHTEGSRRGVTGEGDPSLRLRLDVAGTVRGVTQTRAAASARSRATSSVAPNTGSRPRGSV